VPVPVLGELTADELAVHAETSKAPKGQTEPAT